MKLCDMDTDQFLDTLCELSLPLCRIAEDERTIRALETLGEAELADQPAPKAAASIASALIPLLLQTHREDMLAVLACLTGKPVAALRSQSGLQTVRDACDSLDEVLLDFFACAAGTAQPVC